MMLIGIDPHKSSHTATVIEPSTNSDLGSIRIDASNNGYRQLLAWARQWPKRRWVVENAEGLGHHLALWPVAMGEAVVDVAPAATARVRQLSRGGRRKNDRIDAAAAACVAALHGDARPVRAETHTDSLALLDERATEPVREENSIGQPAPRTAARIAAGRGADKPDRYQCAPRRVSISNTAGVASPSTTTCGPLARSSG